MFEYNISEFTTTLTIPDEVLEQAGLTPHDALVEFACRLFDAGKLTLTAACKLAGLSRDELQAELHARNIPAFRPTGQDLCDDVETLKSRASAGSSNDGGRQ